jgi:beta-galactosidase
MGTGAEHFDLLERMILRDRNHPSVLVWSLGNEEWAIEGNVTGARIAASMQDFARRLDRTRRITAAGSGGWGGGISTVLDVMGFNYIFNGDIDKQHREFPAARHRHRGDHARGTRIYTDDIPNAHMEATDRKPSGTSIVRHVVLRRRPFHPACFSDRFRSRANRIHSRPQADGSDQTRISDMFYYIKSWWTELSCFTLPIELGCGADPEIRVWAHGTATRWSFSRIKSRPESHA